MTAMLARRSTLFKMTFKQLFLCYPNGYMCAFTCWRFSIGLVSFNFQVSTKINGWK